MLKTSCNFCIFRTNENKCLLAKETFQFNDIQHTYGLCRHKRMPDWLEKQSNKNSKSLINTIEKEEKKVAFIISFLDDDINKLYHTISSIVKYSDYLNQLIIVARNQDKFVELANTLEKATFKWTLSVIKEDIEPDNLYIMDMGVDQIKSAHWFFLMKSGEEFLYHYDFIMGAILSNNNNTVCAYVDENNNENIFANRFAFKQMQGNFPISWFEKIKQFSNWNNLCIKIPLKWEQ